MPFKIVISDKAKFDIQESIHYYHKISKDLSARFSLELVNDIDGLKENPYHFQIRYKIFRIAFTEIFPFRVHFFIEESTIYVQGVLHNKRFYKN